MCFRFGSCFGGGSGQDYGRSASKATHHGGGGRQADHGYYSGADHKSGPQAYHIQTAATVETRPDAHHAGGARKDHVHDASGHGAYAQNKADDTLKHRAAWSSKVGEAGLREDAAAADPREHAAADHHHYPTSITTTTAGY